MAGRVLSNLRHVGRSAAVNKNFSSTIKIQVEIGRFLKNNFLKGVFAKNERGYRLNAIKKRF